MNPPTCAWCLQPRRLTTDGSFKCADWHPGDSPERPVFVRAIREPMIVDCAVVYAPEVPRG